MTGSYVILRVIIAIFWMSHNIRPCCLPPTRQLQSELKRMRETDAASTMELTQDDIVYKEEG